jgi:alpha-glucosidase
LPLGADWRSVNVAAQREDARSMLALYRSLIALRRREPALELGRYRPLPAKGDVLAYIRTARENEPSFLVALNLGSGPQRLTLERGGTVALSTHLDRANERADSVLELRPDEGVIVKLANGD